MAPLPPVVALAKAMIADECEVNSCLRFVRQLYGHDGIKRVPAVNFTPGDFRVPFAADAYEHAAKKHKPRKGVTPKAPPVGVPVWWTGGLNGHVAISAGHGYVISTDYPHATNVSRVAIADLTRDWNKTYRGWSEDINDVTVFRPHEVNLERLQAAAVAQTPGAVAARKGCLLVNASLYVEGLLGESHVFDEHLSPKAVHAYRKWQHKLGINGNGVPDKRSLTRLGKRNGFTVA